MYFDLFVDAVMRPCFADYIGLSLSLHTYSIALVSITTIGTAIL